MFAQVVDLEFARHGVFARGRNDLELAVERHDAGIEAHLVVPFAGAAVSDCVRAFFVGHIDQELRHQRASQCSGERIGVLVHSTGSERGEGEVTEEILLCVDDAHLERARGEPTLFHDRLFAALPHVDIERDDIVALLNIEPLDGGGRIQTAGIRENELRHRDRS